MASVLSDPRRKTVYMTPILEQSRHKTGYMASGDNRGQKVPLLASLQYSSVPHPRQNVENNWGRKPLLHWCLSKNTFSNQLFLLFFVQLFSVKPSFFSALKI